MYGLILFKLLLPQICPQNKPQTEKIMAPAGLSRRSHALSAGNGGAQPSAMPWFWVERPSAHPGLDGPAAPLGAPRFSDSSYPTGGRRSYPAQAGGQLGEKVPPHLVLLNGLQKGAQLSPIQNLLWEVIGL